ncbi:MAG: hypothetical protein KKE20_02185 [Nanoarchaeota archaeon]|nr:hypothetical protein [Nanoarchaeota archaeon]
MKKYLVLLLVLAFCMPLVAAQGIHEPGTGIEEPELRESAQGTGQGLQQNDSEGEPALVSAQIRAESQERQRLMAHSPGELREMMQLRQQEMNQELQGFKDSRQKVYQNQNIVRLAVHSLLAMENLTDGIGPQVSAIARDFNNSVQRTMRSEERVLERGRFKRFFAGGDSESADEIEQEANLNQQRIQQLRQLREQCNCSEEIGAMMQERLQEMDHEQTRLKELAQSEKRSKGIFGWIWK